MASDDRELVQAAFESRLVDLNALLAEGKHGEALAILDALRAQHAAHDHDGWLARSVLAFRAMILDEQGDHAGAIAAQLEVLESATEPSALASEGLALATYLERGGQLDDAAAACEQALAHCTGSATPTAISLLRRYASIQQARGQVIPESFRTQLDAALAFYGIAAAPATESIEAAVARAHQALLDAQRRYQALHAKLARTQDPAARAAEIDAFTAAEPVGFFRDQAQRLR